MPKSTTRASKPAKSETPKAAPVSYRVACADEYAALRGAVQAIQRLGYRHPGQKVVWAKPEHRKGLGDNVPENGTPMPEAMTTMIANLRSALDGLERAVAAIK